MQQPCPETNTLVHKKIKQQNTNLFLSGISETTWIFSFSLLIVTSEPRLPFFPPTFRFSWRNWSCSSENETYRRVREGVPNPWTWELALIRPGKGALAKWKHESWRQNVDQLNNHWTLTNSPTSIILSSTGCVQSITNFSVCFFFLDFLFMLFCWPEKKTFNHKNRT